MVNPKKMIDEFVCLRTKMHGFICESESKNKLKVFVNPNLKILSLRNEKNV